MSERTRSATFGPVVVSLANHGTYEVELPGDNFGLAWRATRLYFPLEGELRFRPAGGAGVGAGAGAVAAGAAANSGARVARSPHALPKNVGARGAALAAGWHPFQLASSGAQVLEVDIATERFDERDLLVAFNFAAWEPESCLPSATAAALRELIDRPGSGTSAPVRAETNRVVTALLATMLHAARLATETSGAPAAPARLADAGEATDGPKVTRAEIMKYLNRKYRDADLTPAAVAEHFHVSLRTLYRCFDDAAGGTAGRLSNERQRMAVETPSGDGVSGVLAQLRLEQALKLLADPRFADYTLDELAEMCGYRTALSLRRAVQAATGQTPSHLRAAN